MAGNRFEKEYSILIYPSLKLNYENINPDPGIYYNKMQFPEFSGIS